MGNFDEFVRRLEVAHTFAVQPRMGFSNFSKMRRGLMAVKNIAGPTVGTITIDSFTRLGNFNSAAKYVESDQPLNGYPLVAYSDTQNRALLKGIVSQDFPVQVRHGSPLPTALFHKIVAAGLDATEGGPLSYCLPYSRVPVTQAIDAWAESCRVFAGVNGHIESFGGCMLGQLCPPSLLIAICVLEGLFFIEQGVRSVSLSFAQGYNMEQDLGAIAALQELARKYLDADHLHIVVYTFMGLFPRTETGAQALIKDSALLTKAAGAARLIVKTVFESRGIPEIDHNLTALRLCLSLRNNEITIDRCQVGEHYDAILEEANSILEAVLNSAKTTAQCLAMAVRKGLLDVPYCLHPDNVRKTTSRINEQGHLCWNDIGNLPIKRRRNFVTTDKQRPVSSQEFLLMLGFNQRRYDEIVYSSERST